jgi:hypothetical protein
MVAATIGAWGAGEIVGRMRLKLIEEAFMTS